MEPSKISCGVVGSDRSPGKTKLNEPPQEPPTVICGTMHSQDVTVTSLNVPPTGSKLESQKDPIWVSVSHTMRKTRKSADAKHGNYRAQVQQTMQEDIVGKTVLLCFAIWWDRELATASSQSQLG